MNSWRWALGLLWAGALCQCRAPTPEKRPPEHPPVAANLAAEHTQTTAESVAAPATPDLAEAVSPSGLASATVAGPDAATATDDVLVWARTDKMARTWWLQGQGTDWTLLAERNGIWSAGRDDVFGLRETARRVKVCDPTTCADPEGGCEPLLVSTGPFAGRIYDAAWVALLGERTMPIGPRMPDNAAVALGSPGLLHRLVPVAQLDDLFLVEVVTETWSCGAMNGRTIHEPRRLWVPDGHLSTLLPGTGEVGVVATDGAQAEVLLRAQFPTADGPLRWQIVHLRTDATFAWRVEHLFARDERSDAGFTLVRRVNVTATAQFDDIADRIARAPDVRSTLGSLVAGLADSKREKNETTESPWFGFSHVTLRGARLEAARQRFQCAKAAP